MLHCAVTAQLSAMETSATKTAAAVETSTRCATVEAFAHHSKVRRASYLARWPAKAVFQTCSSIQRGTVGAKVRPRRLIRAVASIERAVVRRIAHPQRRVE